jgi:hypothetical protein
VNRGTGGKYEDQPDSRAVDNLERWPASVDDSTCHQL